MVCLRISSAGSSRLRAWPEPAGCLGERLTRLKLPLDDPSEGALYLFEALEVLSLGIEGKRGLWQALASSPNEIRSFANRL